MTKTDLESAFRLIPIYPDDWNLLGIYWQLQLVLVSEFGPSLDAI